MEIQLRPDMHAQLTRLATEQGCDPETLVAEALERWLDYDRWFLLEAERGLEEADRGERIDHLEIRRQIEQRYPPLPAG